MRRGSTLLILLVSCGGSGALPPATFEPLPELGPTPNGAVVLKREVTLRFADRDGAIAETEERVALRVIDSAAATPYQTLAFSSGRRGRVTELIGRRSRPSGEVEVQRWSGEGGAALRFRALRDGDRLDWRVVYLSDDPEAAPPLVAAGPDPSLTVTLRVQARDGFEVTTRAGDGAGPGARLEPGDEWEQSYERVPAIPQDRLAPHPQRQGPWLLAVATKGVSNDRVVDYASSWTQVARRLADRALATADVPAWEKGALARGDGRRRLAAVREMFPVDPTVPLFDRPARPFAQLAGAVTPFEAAKVMEAASGRAFEKTQIALVASATGPLVFDDLPGLYGFTTAAVALQSGGRWTFAVPGCVTCAYGRVPIDLAGARAFVADPKAPVLLSVPRVAVDTSSVRGQVSWRVSAAGRMTGSGLVELRGEAARQVFERSQALQSEATLRDALNRYWLGTDDVQIRTLVEPDVLRAGEALPVKVELRSQGNARKIRLSEITGRSLPWFPPLDEPRALVLPAPLREEAVHTVQLRGSALAVTPGTASFSSDVGSVTVSYSQSGRLLTIRRLIEITDLLIPASRFSELQALLQAAREADESELTLIF